MTGFKIPTWWEADQLATNMSQELELLSLLRNNSCLVVREGLEPATSGYYTKRPTTRPRCLHNSIS